MTFLNNLFATKETKKTLQTLDELGKDILQKLEEKNLFDIHYAWSITEQEIKKLITANSKKLTEAIREGKRTPKHLVLNMINKVSRNHCTNGQHHIYRGVLNGTGEAFYDIFKYTMVNFEKMEVITKEQSNEIMEEVQEEIKFVG
jgi:hypothetical protein